MTLVFMLINDSVMKLLAQFLFDAATANCVELATDRHGCCVLQKCLTHFEGEQRRQLVSEITSNALILSQDPFGYIIFSFPLFKLVLLSIKLSFINIIL